MDKGTWSNNSGNGDACCCWSRSSSIRDYDRFVTYAAAAPSSRRSKITIWSQLWRKIKRERKRMLDCSSSSMRFSYDPYTYSQNFDQGLTWADPDDLSRSFSARFAVPSKIFDKDVLMV